MEVIINQLGNIEVIPPSSPVLELNINQLSIKGNTGKSAYQIAVDNGFIGTEQEWINDLKSIEWSSTNW